MNKVIIASICIISSYYFLVLLLFISITECKEEKSIYSLITLYRMSLLSYEYKSKEGDENF